MPPRKGATREPPATAAASRPRRSIIPPKRKSASDAPARVKQIMKFGGPSADDDDKYNDEAEDNDDDIPPPKKAPKAKAASAKSTTKKRGRPAVSHEGNGDEDEDDQSPPPSKKLPKRKAPAPKSAPAVKKRGKPSAAREEEDDEEADGQAPPAKKRGRTQKADSQALTSKNRSAKIAKDNEPAAILPAARTDAKKTKFQKAADNDVQAEDDSSDERPADVRNYWLMKAEQEDRFETTKDGTQFNTKFTIDDLRANNVPEPWDGVRNPVAAKNMKAMRKGDLAFFYASGGKSGRKPGITGIMEIVSEAEPDPTVNDTGSYGFVEKESDRGKWVIVKVQFRKKLLKPVSLKELQKYQLISGVLDDMQLFKQSRLSVSHVTEAEYLFIVNNLIEGYDEDQAPEASDAYVEVSSVSQK